MFLGCLTWHGVGRACKKDGIMNSSLSCEILSDNFLGTTHLFSLDLEKLFYSRIGIQNVHAVGLNNGSPIKMSRYGGTQSPDLNTIEHLWIVE